MIVAHITYWSGSTEDVEIKREWIDGIVSAVKGQYTFFDNKEGFHIRGQYISKVDIYEV